MHNNHKAVYVQSNCRIWHDWSHIKKWNITLDPPIWQNSQSQTRLSPVLATCTSDDPSWRVHCTCLWSQPSILGTCVITASGNVSIVQSLTIFATQLIVDRQPRNSEIEVAVVAVDVKCYSLGCGSQSVGQDWAQVSIVTQVSDRSQHSLQTLLGHVVIGWSSLSFIFMSLEVIHCVECSLSLIITFDFLITRPGQLQLDSTM